MKITQATKDQAREIAKLIMLAMNYECCQNLAGPNHTLNEFEDLMTELVSMDESQYSYKNTFVALNDNNEVAGICVSYHGADLKKLRQVFIEKALQKFNIDYQDMKDEAQPDELYIDSIAILPQYRRKGIAKELIMHALNKAKDMKIDKIGLLVDKDNPHAERLYTTQGFRYVDDTDWGGHPMKHLQYLITFYG